MGGVIVDVQRERAIRNFKEIGVSDADKLIDPSHHKGFFFSFDQPNPHQTNSHFLADDPLWILPPYRRQSLPD